MNDINFCCFGFTKNIIFKLVEIEDASLILKLRSDPSLNKHLSSVEDNVEVQRNWIKKYKYREQQGIELYYIICSQDQSKQHGVARVYDICENDKSCRIGSWILKPDAPKFTAIESMVSMYHGLFAILGVKIIHLDVRKDNKAVVSMHKKFGAKFLKEDDLDIYFTLTEADFLPARKRFARFLLPEVLTSLSLKS
ncbi:MAG: GNAT family N-acetyltransferase [Mariprofundaceae bacterium]|nr:GNAT family N-acetyltransferase [Mariprofundaceae bacterium]